MSDENNQSKSEQPQQASATPGPKPEDPKPLVEAANTQNKITGAAAVIALLSLFAVAWSIHDARRATIDANRAWIVPLGVEASGDIKGDKDLNLKIVYDHNGIAPAQKMNQKFDAGTISNAGPAYQPLNAGRNVTCEGLQLADDGPVIYNTKKDHWRETIIPRKLILPSVQTNDGALFVRGCFIYQTMHEVHHSWFCYIVYRNGQYSSLAYSPECAGGQGAD